MSKLIPILFAAAGTSAISVGGIYLYKDEKNANNSTEDTSTKIEPSLVFKDLKNFRTNQGGTCVKKLFQNVNFDQKGKQIENSSKIDDDYFSPNNTEDVQDGCLIVNGERTGAPSSTGSTKAGKGDFRWLGSFKKGTKGFVMFVSAKSSTTDKTMDLEGGIYFVEESTSEVKTGSIQKHKELTSSSISDSTFESSFPKSGTSLRTSLPDDTVVTSKDYGGFVGSKADLNSLCKSSETNCPATQPSTNLEKAWAGTLSTLNATTKLDSGSSNSETGMSTLFGTDVNLKKAVEGIQGTWTAVATE